MKRETNYTRIGKIKIGCNCFIGDSTIVLPGVSIGDNTIIGAGSVVTKNIPANCVAVGNPCKKIMSTREFFKKTRDQIRKRKAPFTEYSKQQHLTKQQQHDVLLFHARKWERIWVYMQPGITAYDQTLGRNLTNDEWARRQFALLNIAEKDIDFVDFEEGFWGTISESQKVLEQAEQQGYVHIHVVTSTYHTRRVWLTFSSFSEENNISFTVYGADDVIYLRYLLKEYGKLLVYQYILLPLSVFRATCW